MHPTTELKRKYDHLLDRFWQLFKYGREREKQLEELVRHCWVYSGYENCGYRKMTTEEKELFDSVTRNHEPD